MAHFIISAEHQNGHRFYAEAFFEITKKHIRPIHLANQEHYTARWGFNSLRAERFRYRCTAHKILEVLNVDGQNMADVKIIEIEDEAENEQY
jgi:hypothetical protein